MVDGYRTHIYGRGDAPLPPAPPEARDAMYYFQGNDGRNVMPKKSPSRPPRHSNYPHRKMSERPLLTSRQHSPGFMTFGTEQDHDRFRQLDELTDTDETEMEFSDDSTDMRRPAKRTKMGSAKESDHAPKWSNPDPYTSLPPVDHTNRKKKDMVKLIRKARNNPDTLQSTVEDLVTENRDFISFDMDGQYSDADRNAAPANAPVGPKSEREQQESVLGKRKRVDDTSRPRIKPPRTGESSARTHQVWQATVNTSILPWMGGCLDPKQPAGIALHKEVLDFYNWIKPTEYESAVRARVVDRLESELGRLEPGELRAFGSYAAGLYLPTGDLDLVYFIRGYNSRAPLRNGLPPKPPHRTLMRFASFLRDDQIAEPHTVLVISGAKVPIVKFVEKESGLKVDLSFNNSSGLPAIAMYELWKARYPLMPVLVSIVKHFLMVRDLNDVATGGLGGYSAICLVTSVIQHMPAFGQPLNAGQFLLEFFNLYGNLLNRHKVAIRLDPPGYVDKASYARQMFIKDKDYRLMIIDPDRPENNISGGTQNIGTICECFAEAYNVLQTTLTAFENNPSSVKSFLERILGNNYTAYEDQRDILYELYYGTKRGVSDLAKEHVESTLLSNSNAKLYTEQRLDDLAEEVTNSARSDDLDTTPRKKRKPKELAKKELANPPSSSNLETTSKGPRKANKHERRAARMKTLRPEIAHRIPDSITLHKALKIGGYTDGTEFAKDMADRAANIAEQEKGT